MYIGVSWKQQHWLREHTCLLVVVSLWVVGKRGEGKVQRTADIVSYGNQTSEESFDKC